MTVNEINSFKALAGDRVIRLFCDNEQVYLSGPKLKSAITIWDDDKELFYYIRPNLVASSQAKYPVEISMIRYEFIQSMAVVATLNDTRTMLECITSDIEDIDGLIERIRVLSGATANSDIKVSDYTDKKKEE